MKNYDLFDKKIVYNFNMGNGGIGDCIKFFMAILELCIRYKYKLYYQINNIPLEKYLRLKHAKMYISKEKMHGSAARMLRQSVRSSVIYNIRKINSVTELQHINNINYYIVVPEIFYSAFNYDSIGISIKDVFDFTDVVKSNSYSLLPSNISTYISLHLRLGDKYLETAKRFVIGSNDLRNYPEIVQKKLYDFIEENSNKNIIFFSDNNEYKKKLKEKYNNIVITNCNIGHTGLSNTTDKQTLDAITEFYLMTKSEKIYCVTHSGFSIVASKFNNIPLINMYA